MAVTITSNKDSGVISNGTPGNGTNITTVGGLTLLRSSGTFTSTHYDLPRIVAVYNSTGATYKGCAWVRQYLDADEIQLETPLIDKDGDAVTPVNGDTFQISKNWADAATTGIAWDVDSRVVTLTDDIIFGTTGDDDSICFYDESVMIVADRAPTSHQFEFRGGLIVFGHLLDYDTRLFSGPCSLTVSQESGDNGDQLIVIDDAAKIWWMGGTIWFGETPARFPGGNDASYDSAFFQKWWGISTNGDMVSPDDGADWPSNPEDQEMADCNLNPNSDNAIALRWADGIVKGGTIRGTAGKTIISMYGSDAAGTFAIGSAAGERARITDLGGDSGTALWRSWQTPTQTINATNLVTPNRVAGTGNDPGSTPGTNQTINFYFSDVFSNVVSGSNFRVEEDDDDSLEDSGTGVSGEVEVTIQEAQVTSGDTETVHDDAWNWAFGHYDYHLVFGQFVTVTETTFGGATSKDVPFNTYLNQLVDLNVTATKTVVDAYTTIDDLSEFYDRAKSYKVDNLNLPSLQVNIAIAAGNEIDIGALNLVIDSSAPSAWSYNPATTPDTITIKPASSFSTSTKFSKLITTGSVTIDANLGSGMTIEGDVYLNSAINLSDVTIDGDLRIDTGADSTLTFTNVIVRGNVYNDATSNTLTINLLDGSSATAGDSGTGNGQTNIIAIVYITLENIIEGSHYRIERNSDGSEIENDVAGNTSVTVPFIFAGNEIVNITIRKSIYSPRYFPFDVSGTVTENGLIINVSQIEDTIARKTELLSQIHYRWRNDDGNETGATWKQNEDVDHTNQAKNQNVRLRILVDEVNDLDASFTPKLQFRKVGETEWNDIEE